MTKKEIERLSNIVEKYYHFEDFMYQHLWVDTIQILDNESWSVDVYIMNPKTKQHDIYLFEIQNYKAFNDFDIYPPDPYFTPRRTIFTWDSVRASCTPLYMDRVYTLPKFTSITEKDILNCTKHFINKVLDVSWIFNIDILKVNKQLEFDFTKNEKN